MRRALTRLALATIVLVAAACTAPSPVEVGRGALGLPTTRSTAQFKDVVKRVWASNNRMNMTDDEGLLDKYETGAAQLGDRAYVAGRKAQGIGPALKAPLPLKSSEVWVPPQSGYPTHMLALVNSVEAHQGLPSSTRSGYFFDLVRTSERASWKIDDWTFLADPGKKPPVTLDSDGQATQLSESEAAGHFVVDPAKISPAYEEFFADTINQTSYHGPFGEDPWTDGLVQDRVSADEALNSSGATLSNAIGQAAGTEVWAAAGGAAVVFFHVAIVQTVAATPGKLKCVVQQGSGKGTYDYTLAPGQYSQAEFDSLYTIAALDPPRGSHAKMKVLAGYGAIIRATGTPANPTSCA
jgi:hypothetical protein